MKHSILGHMTILGNLIVCALLEVASANVSTVGGVKILGELGTAEHMLQSELVGHPMIMQQEMQLLHSAEEAVRRGHAEMPSSEFLQQKGTESLASGTGKILNELSSAEGMLKNELRGHPKILQEEMRLLHGAEDAARHTVTHNPELIQHKTMQSTDLNSRKMLGELGQVESLAQKVLAGHPKELQLEENALRQAEQAAKVFAKPALLQASKVQVEGQQKMSVSTEQLEHQRIRSMQVAMQQERSYGAAERQLAQSGDKLASEFGQIEDSIAQAFAGKDSKAVKTAMQVGELLDKAHGDQQQINKFNVAEATKASTAADRLEAVFAQTSAASKSMQEQRAYTSGMSNLVKEEKSVLSQFSGLKSAVAKAFAGQDDKAVEKAMEVGRLLDEARDSQQQVANRDAKNIADASKLFQDMSQHVQHHDRKAFLQKEDTSLMAAALHASRRQRLALKQKEILRLTENAEDAVTRELAKDGHHEALTAEHEVISMMEQAKKAEEAAYDATSRSGTRVRRLRLL